MTIRALPPIARNPEDEIGLAQDMIRVVELALGSVECSEQSTEAARAVLLHANATLDKALRALAAKGEAA